MTDEKQDLNDRLTLAFFPSLTAVFAALKLSGVAGAVSWWAVFSPLILMAILAVVLVGWWIAATMNEEM